MPVHSLVGVSARPRLVVVSVGCLCAVVWLLWRGVGGLVVGRIVDAGGVCVVAWVVCVVSAG